MNYLLILLSVVCFAVNSTVTRAVQVKYPGRCALLKRYQAGYCLTSTACFFCSYLVSLSGREAHSIERFPLLLLFGVLFGIFFFTATWGSARGYETGSMSLTSIILNMSLLIPLVYSCVFLNETLNAVRLIGILLIAITMILAVEKSKEHSNATLKWFIIVFIAFFANGITAVIQKDYVVRAGEAELMLLMAIAYFVTAAMFSVDSFVTAKKEPAADAPAHASVGTVAWTVIAFSLASGLGSFGGNALLGYLCVQVDGAILYPCINGGLCMLCAIISFTVFKEKPSRRKLIAIVMGLGAIVLLNL